tara:strand:+ start:2986 stop:3183 length:198 start_codon:yes stop_codon:yes gene_type:complete
MATNIEPTPDELNKFFKEYVMLEGMPSTPTISLTEAARVEYGVIDPVELHDIALGAQTYVKSLNI